MSAKIPKVVNGKPYYPSVEEVMALLHADRADVIERVSKEDSSNTHDHLQVEASAPADVTAEQREQERLRSEVVGRIEPKLAFTDETKDITAGVLPTTIRRNSPSGSLSSIDSLDAVPDEELEKMPVSTESPIASIIRRGNKAKRDSRVTFNENVTFSDGLVGALKRKHRNESADTSFMPKQKSYFGLPENHLGEKSNKETKLKITGTGLETSRDSLILNHYASKQSKSNTPVSTAQNYPHVNSSDMATTGVMTYSVANDNNRQSGSNVTPKVAVDGPEIKTNTLHVLPNSPRDKGHVGYANHMTSSQTGSSTRSDGTEKNHTSSYKSYISHKGQTTGSQASTIPKHSSLQEINGLNGDTSDNIPVHTSFGKRSNETQASSHGMSSINASMLKDSLEMHNDIRFSQNGSNPRNETFLSNPEKHSSGIVSTHSEVLPETPLIPVTKRDFLSKALRSNTNDVPAKMSDHTRNHAHKDEMTIYDRIESTTHKYSGGNPLPSPKKQGLDGASYSLYSQDREVSQNRQIGKEQYEGTKSIYNEVDQTGERFHNDSYNKAQTVPSASTRKEDSLIPSSRNDKLSSGKGSLNEGCQHTSRDIYGIQRPNRTIDGSSSALPTRSKCDSTEKLKITQNTPSKKNTAIHPSYETMADNGQQCFSSRKPSSADELLKSVQENIERLRMTPSQQGISRPGSSIVKLTGPLNAETNRATTSESRHNRTNSDNSRRTKTSEKADQSSPLENRGNAASAAIGRERKLSNRKIISNGQKSKLVEAKKVNESNKRLHRNGSDSGIANERNGVNLEYEAIKNSSLTKINGTNSKQPSTYSSAYPNQVYTSPDHKTDYNSPTYQRSNRSYGVISEPNALHPPQTSTFQRKQRKNSEGLAFLDKTPTDEEINHLWETVRTCLKHEQPQKAASDSVVNNVRYSRSESGPLVGNHYLIEGNAWASKQSAGSDSQTRYSKGTASTHFRRQGSLDSLQRRGSDSVGYVPPRKGSLLQHRTSTSERRLTPRNSQTGRPPVNPQYLHSFRGPMTSSRGPVKSNTVKTEGRPQLSYAEFQAVMQASADIKTRNTEGNHKSQNVHKPIIMNYRKGEKNNYFIIPMIPNHEKKA